VDGRHVRPAHHAAELFPLGRPSRLAFCAGIGAKAACPDRPVVVFTGDAGFWYHIGEIETAVRWKLNSVTV
jgi:glyoxylate carboligase